MVSFSVGAGLGFGAARGMVVVAVPVAAKTSHRKVAAVNRQVAMEFTISSNGSHLDVRQRNRRSG